MFFTQFLPRGVVLVLVELRALGCPPGIQQVEVFRGAAGLVEVPAVRGGVGG